MGALVIISLLQLKTPSILAEAANTTKNTDTNEGEETEKNPDPVPDPAPNPPPENEGESTPPPESKPEPEQEVPVKPKPETDSKEPAESMPGGNSNSNSTINKKPVQSNKPATNWSRPPVRSSGTNSVKSNWTPTTVPSNSRTTTNVDSQTTTNEPTEEVITEEPEPEVVVEIEEEVNVEDYSIEELILMIERGEAKGEVKGDKYFVIFEADLENREVTKAEAIKLGIIEEDIEEVVEIDLDTEVSEPAAVELVTGVKNEKTKMPLYISLVGLATVIIGAFAYIVQWRRTSV